MVTVCAGGGKARAHRDEVLTWIVSRDYSFKTTIHRVEEASLQWERLTSVSCASADPPEPCKAEAEQVEDSCEQESLARSSVPQQLETKVNRENYQRSEITGLCCSAWALQKAVQPGTKTPQEAQQEKW